MALKKIALELGHGTSLRREDYTAAADRAIKNALWRNSVSVAPAFGFPKEAMIVEVEVAVQNPDAVDTDALKTSFPYGQISVKAVPGGLDVEKPHGAGKTIIANAAVSVFFDMEAV